MARTRTKAPAKAASNRSSAPAKSAGAVSDPMWLASQKDLDFIDTQTAYDRIVVIPTPALALDYAFGCNGVPLGRIIHLLGESGHRKSTLLLEIFRWFFCFDGYSALALTEGKDLPHLRQMAFRHESSATTSSRSRAARCQTAVATSMEEWHAGVTFLWDALRKAAGAPLIGAKKGKGGSSSGDDAPATKAKKTATWDRPYVMGVDSVVGTTTNRIFEKAHAEGYAPQEIGPEANFINRVSKTWPSYLQDTSMTFVLVNHDKPILDKFNNVSHKYQGGKALKFYATLELVINRLGRYKAQKRSGHLYRITPIKPSFATDDGRSIDVPYYAWTEFTAKGPRSQARWAWSEATARLFESLRSKDHTKPLYKVLADVADVRKVSETRCACPKLGIKAENSVTWEEMGRIIDGDAKLRWQLQEIMGVQQFKLFEPGKSLEQIKPATVELYEKALKRVVLPDDVPTEVGVPLLERADQQRILEDDSDVDETPVLPVEEEDAPEEETTEDSNLEEDDGEVDETPVIPAGDNATDDNLGEGS